MRRSLTLAALAVSLAALAGCDGQLEGEFNQKLVVSANLGAGEPLPPISLSVSSPLLDDFDPGALVVGDAEVTVALLAADGSDEDVLPYRFSERERAYLPNVPLTPTVLPGRTYRLDVRARGETLTATTTVPALVDVVRGPADAVVYGVGQGPEVQIRSSSTAERRAAFVASTRARGAADFERVTIEGEVRFRSVPGSGALPVPVYQRFLDCEPEAGGTILCGDDPEDSRIGTSPVINEDSYIDLGDGTVLVQVPFLAFGYYGPYEISLTSLDAALQAFVQTQAIQGGGTTLSPGEIPNVTSNVEGGLGVFGSYAQVVVQTEITER